MAKLQESPTGGFTPGERDCFILRNVWGSRNDVGNDLQYLRMYIRSIRRKIELVPADPRILLTEQGIGYSLHPTEQATAS